jgi:hypothetical protein
VAAAERLTVAARRHSRNSIHRRYQIPSRRLKNSHPQLLAISQRRLPKPSPAETDCAQRLRRTDRVGFCHRRDARVDLAAHFAEPWLDTSNVPGRLEAAIARPTVPLRASFEGRGVRRLESRSLPRRSMSSPISASTIVPQRHDQLEQITSRGTARSPGPQGVQTVYRPPRRRDIETRCVSDTARKNVAEVRECFMWLDIVSED